MNQKIFFIACRMMRSHTNNEWEKFHPKTNVMWLHYMLDKLTGEGTIHLRRRQFFTIFDPQPNIIGSFLKFIYSEKATKF